MHRISTRKRKFLTMRTLCVTAAALVTAPFTSIASQSSPLVIEEVLVTAQKKSESAKEVPMAIQAYSGDMLERSGITNAADLTQVTPGLTYAKSPANTPIFTIRGVGFNTSNLSSTPTVGLYVDEVSYAYPYMMNGMLYDMERVEVLKGPQGTLYGRNTTGGLVNFITNKPSSEFEAGFSVDIGNFETTNIDGYLNIPLSDRWAARVAGRVDRSREGWQKNAFDASADELGEVKKWSLRGILDGQVTDSLSATLTVAYWEDSSDTLAGQFIDTNFDQRPFAAQAVLDLPLDQRWDNDLAGWNSEGGPFDNPLETDSDFISTSLRVEYDLSDTVSLISLTAYNEIDRFDGNDFDGSNVEIFHLDSDGSVESFSQEFRFAGSSGDVDYIVGVFYSYDDIVDNQVGSYSQSSQGELLRHLAQNVFDPTNAFYTAEQYENGFHDFRLNLASESESYAIFGKLDYSLTEDLSVSLGLRYTDDQLEAESCSADYNGQTLPIWNTAVWALVGNAPPGPVEENGCMTMLRKETGTDANGNPIYEYRLPDDVAVRDPLEEDNVSGRLSIDYKPSDDLLIYGSFSVGYKSGAWPLLTAATTNQLDAATQERLDALELGTKITLLEGRAQLNTSAFYYWYEDKQLLSEVEDPVFQTLPRLVNIPESNVYGAEVDLDVILTEALTGRFSVAYTESEVESYVGFRRRGQLDSFNGDEFPYTPELQLSSFLRYERSIADGYSMASSLSMSYQSESSSTIGREEGFDIKSYTLINLELTLLPDAADWSVSLYGKNLGDKYYWTSVDVQTDAVYRLPGMPRQYGVRFTKDFE